MEIHLCSGADFHAFESTLLTLDASSEAGALVLLIPEGNGWPADDIGNLLQSLRTPLLGGIFPQVIFQRTCLQHGAVIWSLPQPIHPVLLPLGTADASDLSEKLIEEFPDQYQQNTLLVFTDGLASGCSMLIDELFGHFGLEINFVGGGAGSLTLQQQPCVLSNQGVLQNVAVVALLDRQSGLGVAHGWKPITEAFRVTESDGNRIISLNWQPAFELYQKVIADHGQQQITADNFFDIAKAYPFGITKLNHELVVRDPIAVDNNQLICVGDVPQGSFVHILNGDICSLPFAAAEARDKAVASSREELIKGQLFIDCISRVLFLQEHFQEELDQAALSQVPMIGALTLGEIANNGQDYLEFYNKTAVVALIQEP